MKDLEKISPMPARGLLEWLGAAAGWLICAALCLWATIFLEAWPNAYEIFFPAIILVLFCNVFVFLFISSRCAGSPGKLAAYAARAVLGEGLLLAGMCAIGRFAF